MNELAKMRKEYKNEPLDEKTIPENPFELFSVWLNEAMESAVPEPNAVAVATVSKKCEPSIRMVLLKDFSELGFTFFTNYNSQKGRDLCNNPAASMLFFWAELERQVRINGIIEKVPEKESDEYFALRPRGSQLGAWASKQSSILENRTQLESNFSEAEKAFAEAPIPRPKWWGGYRLVPNSFEFWQGRTNRLHDRIIYIKEIGHWKRERLSP